MGDVLHLARGCKKPCEVLKGFFHHFKLSGIALPKILKTLRLTCFCAVSSDETNNAMEAEPLMMIEAHVTPAMWSCTSSPMS